MNFKSYLLTSCVAFALLATSGCKDDDDNSYSQKDPRISYVSIKGINSRIVINDYERKIYNTDSLTYGTDISSMSIFFAGYDVTTGIEVEKDGVWVPYSNNYNDTSKFDLSNLKVRSTSVDRSSTIEYTVALRVRNFDINSLVWDKLSSLPVSDNIVGGRAIADGDNYKFFYADDEGNLHCLYSSDLKNWSSAKMQQASSASGSFVWNSLIADADNNLYLPLATDGSTTILSLKSSAASGYTIETDSIGMSGTCVPDFLINAINDKFYALTADSLCLRSDSGYHAVAPLPAGFPSESLTSFVTRSGRTYIAYIYGLNNCTASLWVLDANGLFKQLASSSSGLPVVRNAALVAVDNEIGLIGGNDLDGNFLTSFYSSADAGITWTDNWHKKLPGNIGGIANLSVIPVSNDEFILIGGENENGALDEVWRAKLSGAE